MGWKDAKEAGKEGFKQSTNQLKDGKVKSKDTAKSAQKVANKVEEERAKRDKEKK
jgi:hypothetical protein